MKRCILLGPAVGLIALSAWSAAQQPGSEAGSQADDQAAPPQAGTDIDLESREPDGQTQGGDPVARGRYIVHHVAMCIYCHTPRQDGGEIDRQKLLTGARMPVKSPFPEQQWCFQAPGLAGLPGGWSRQEMVQFLQTGVRPGGTSPRPPMPPFRMSERDARAVAAYLESLR